MTEQLIEGRGVRGLTLWRPWPWTFTHADKRVENRKWPAPRSLYGCWLALHAGKRFDAEAAEDMRNGDFTDAGAAVPIRSDDHPHSVIVALARLAGCRKKESIFRKRGEEWHFGPYCWELDEIRVFVEPVPCKGAQGLWRLPADVFTAVCAQAQAPQQQRLD